MPSVSISQKNAAGMALAAKRGKISASKLNGAAKGMYESMTAEQLEHYAGTKTEGLPERRGGNMKHKSYMKRRREGQAQ
jgi:hypothetical protein